MQHIKEMIPPEWRKVNDRYNSEYFRQRIPELDLWSVPDEEILRRRALLFEYLRQKSICALCQGYNRCGKEGDMKGFEQTLEQYGNQVTVRVDRCQPFADHRGRQKLRKWFNVAGALPQDTSFQFANFPTEQRRKYPKLLSFAERFANRYEIGAEMSGVYLFGPPGVGKTHLMLAVLNKLVSRDIPCLFVRSDTIFDRMRQIVAEGGDLEAFLETCSSVPVLGIDEFAQERANEFTLEKLFRIVNTRFHAGLPTWFTSNYAPPNIYKRNGEDILESVGPLRSRIMQMSKLAKVDGEDARQRNLESLT
ncbi:AFG1/ZapE family ATPase [Alicyclobacillus sp. SO9]|uniref:AFG1/ZapE family ATPase n=1 Tax=Alicyclobacillus sp. SO9 TaxID=2665646 RepID=UPI0018E8DB2B|nr:AFG1/ZapE family ATPase [Alicyclobacillus sp. SO9]QQE76988.1 ATP-binding protein [Alicyclobacillus sp. SO9]